MSPLTKNTYREILRSPGRFLAILAIIVLGSGFFVGLRVSQKAMTATAATYLEKTSFHDFSLASTLGYTAENVTAVAADPDVLAAEGAFEVDALVNLGGETDLVYAFHSMPELINTPDLTSGRMPSAAGECLADSWTGLEIGDTVYLSSANDPDTADLFTVSSFTVTGIATSPLYLNFERGSTDLGAGSVSAFCYVPASAFDADYFTSIYVRCRDMPPAYSKSYDARADELEPHITDLAEREANERYESVVSDAEAELADGTAEYDDALAEYTASRSDAERVLQDARRELDDAKRELDDALAQIEDGEAALADGRRELQDSEKTLSDAKRTLDETKAQLDDAERELSDGRAQYEAGVAELEARRSQAEAELSAAESDLAAAKAELDAQEAQYSEGVDAYTAGMSQYEAGLDTYTASAAALEAAEAQYSEALASYTAQKSAFDAAVAMYGLTPDLQETAAQLEAAKATLDATRAQLDKNAGELAASAAVLDATKTQLDEAKTQLDDARAQLDAGWDEYNAGTARLEASRAQLEAGMADAESTLAASLAQLEEAEAQYNDGMAQYESGLADYNDGLQEFNDGAAELADREADLEAARRDYADGLREYEDGEAEYAEAKADAEAEFADAEAELADARRELDDARADIDAIERPDTYVLGRWGNLGYVCFENDTSIVRAISAVFPVFFFLVAALICLTTVSRMVEEQRSQLGVLLALGYSPMSVMGKFLFYSGSATLLGSVSGILLGSKLIPMVIWKAYNIMYSFSDAVEFYFDLPLSAVTFAAYLASMLAVTYMTCKKELRDVPANIIRPKPPRSGKRVVLERVPFIWNRLSFLWKVTVRNIFRYKSRVLMMVIGIAGCTALMMTGMGVNDSVRNVVDYQFTEISLYDFSVTFSDALTAGEQAEFLSAVSPFASTTVFLNQQSMTAGSGHTEKEVQLNVVPESSAAGLSELVDFHSGSRDLALPGDGQILINTGLAESLDIGPGDALTLRSEDGATAQLTVSGVYDNYIYNSVYVTDRAYAAAFGEDPGLNYALLKKTDSAATGESLASILSQPNVLTATASQDLRTRIGGMMDSLIYIVLLTIVCAAALAFVVIYNLTNINIQERLREIATVKVLGFYDKETALYVLRENILLTLLGAAAGIPLGFALNAYVVGKIELDMIHFTPRILATSCMYSVALTIAFSLIVDLFMLRRLHLIDPASALKAAE